MFVVWVIASTAIPKHSFSISCCSASEWDFLSGTNPLWKLCWPCATEDVQIHNYKQDFKKKKANNCRDCLCCNSLVKFKLHLQITLRNFITATEVFLWKSQVVNNHLVKQVVKRCSIQQGCSLWHILKAEAPSQFTDAVSPHWRLSFSVAMPIPEIKPDAGWKKDT